MSPLWRPEDEALLRRLEDEELLRVLFRHHTHSRGAPPPSRATGMLSLIWATEQGAVARTRALSGDLAPLLHELEQGPLAGQKPELLHHIALYMGRVAGAVEGDAPERAAELRVRELAAWLALVEERGYLMDLASKVIGSQLPQGEIERAVNAVVVDALADLARKAEMGARERTSAGAAALRALARVDEACKAAAIHEDQRARMLIAARAKRRAAVETALSPLAEAMDDATVRGTLVEQAKDILLPALSIWRWAEHDEGVERFVVDHTTEVAWDLYRASRWDALRGLMEPFEPLVDRLCVRAQRDPDSLAYLAPCAQMLVFRSEVAQTLDRQIALAERALALCPAHRNARIVLASYLCHDASRRMNRPTLLVTHKELAEIASLLERAERLNPSSRTLAKAKARYAEHVRTSGRRP